MGIVDAKRRFIWASSGTPGSNHDASTFTNSNIYSRLCNFEHFPDMYKEIKGVKVPPILLGDSAFPHHTWLQKPYSKAELTSEELNLNYRMSRGRIVVECAFGELKGRWRILHKKQECHAYTLKRISLACVVLHNICIDMRDKISMSEDLNTEAAGLPLPKYREKLLMMTGPSGVMSSTRGAHMVRDTLKEEFWRELSEKNGY